MCLRSLRLIWRPGLSRKDRKHMAANTFSHIPQSSHSCYDRRYSYFARQICSRCVNSFKILFGTSSEACSVIVTTIWRPGFSQGASAQYEKDRFEGIDTRELNDTEKFTSQVLLQSFV